MRKIFHSGIAAAALLSAAFVSCESGLSPAHAAEPAKGPANLSAPAPNFDWAGFYAGVDGGYISSRGSLAFGTNLGFGERPTKSDPDGFLGGIHIGYRWQLPSNIVLGVEADIFGINASGRAPYGPVTNEGILDLNWGASLRGTVGIAMSPTLLYATGGVSFIDYDGCTTGAAPGSACAPLTSFSDHRTAWTIGGGLAHAFTPSLVARIEYLYADYGDKTYAVPGLAGGRTIVDLQTHIVRGGLSWRFMTR